MTQIKRISTDSKLYIIQFVVCFSFFIFNFSLTNAQCLEQGTNIIGVGARLGIYNLTSTELNPPAGATNTTGTGRAGMIIYPFSFDHAINDRFTVGGQFRYNSFIIGKDTSAQQLNVAWGMDLCANAAFHFVRSQHVDLYIQAYAGYAYLKLANTNLAYEGVFTANGITYGLELGARFYIGNHIGILLNFAYSGYYYPNGTANGSGGSTENLSLFFTGSTYGTGLCYRFK